MTKAPENKFKHIIEKKVTITVPVGLLAFLLKVLLEKKEAAMIKEQILGRVLKGNLDNKVARQMAEDADDEDQAVDGAGAIIARLVDEHGGREFLAAVSGIDPDEFNAGLAEQRKAFEEASDLSRFHKPFDTKH